MKEKKQKNSSFILWPIKILILALVFSLCFSLLSEIALSNASIIVAVIVILVFVALGIYFDVLGLAVASANIRHFTAMAARKVKGSKQAISLIKNADKVSSVCNDVFGDVCGILAGAAGASIIAKIVLESDKSFLSILIPALVSAVIAGLTIFGKAIFKRYARNNANQITLRLAKFLNFFTRKG